MLTSVVPNLDLRREKQWVWLKKAARCTTLSQVHGAKDHCYRHTSSHLKQREAGAIFLRKLGHKYTQKNVKHVKTEGEDG